MKIDISREDSASGGRYVARMADASDTAELTYRRNGTVLIADHTFVPTDLRGRGIASRLVEKLVEDVRNEGLTIEPVCPFVAAKFAENGDAWADIRATG